MKTVFMKTALVRSGGLSLLPLIALLSVAPLASADALPDCPEGTHLEENPVDPGAMHHNGGECVDDGGGGCSVSPRPMTPRFGAFVVGVFLLGAGRRARRR